jgi:thiamine-phosphate pyrophosphorylase
MHRRQPLPRRWLLTDERQGEALWKALERLPRGSGIVFRHYGLDVKGRTGLLQRVLKVAQHRRLLVVVAGEARLRADGVHGVSGPRAGRAIRTASAHCLKEIRAAERAGIDLLFVSPVFATRSHPGARTLGRRGFAALARRTKLPVIALGGMNDRRARTLIGAYGWGGIDAWSG